MLKGTVEERGAEALQRIEDLLAARGKEGENRGVSPAERGEAPSPSHPRRIPRYAAAIPWRG